MFRVKTNIMENFIELINNLQQSSLKTYFVPNRNSFKVYFFAFNGDFNYVQFIKDCDEYIVYFGTLYLDVKNKQPYEDTPLSQFNINYDEFNYYKRKFSNEEYWRTNEIPFLLDKLVIN